MNIMEKDFTYNRFSRTILAGLFVGLMATLVSLIYNLAFREATSFELTDLINVSTIIFSVPFVLLGACCVYYWLGKYRFGQVLYFVVMAVITVILIVLDYTIRRSPDAALTAEFHRLLLGVIIISGISSLFIPYMVTHENGVI
jgi:ABC-type Fe3+ transport system permease subunit